jgi:membrane fusion protein (multidrug efflux system)
MLFLSGLAFFMWDTFGQLKSRKAFINGSLVPLRAPINGNLKLIPLRPGQVLPDKQALGSLDNPRTADLELNTEHLKAKVIEDEGELATLKSILAERQKLYERFSKMGSLQKNYDVSFAQSRLERLQSERADCQKSRDFASSEAQKWDNLAQAGAVPRLEAERRKSEADRSMDGLLSREADMHQAEAQLQAAKHGLVVDGNRTLSYAHTRLNELETEISDLKLRVTDASTHLKEDQFELKKAEGQLALNKHAELKVPSPGVVWSVATRAGEYLSAGQSVATILDPSDRWVETFVTENDLRRIHLGQRVTVQLPGDPQAKFEGRIESIRAGVGRVNPGQIVAVPPPEKSRNEADLHISLQWPQGSEAAKYGFGPEEFYGVGRSVEVIF